MLTLKFLITRSGNDLPLRREQVFGGNLCGYELRNAVHRKVQGDFYRFSHILKRLFQVFIKEKTCTKR